MATIREAFAMALKWVVALVLMLIVLVAYGSWREQQRNDATQARLNEIMKPDPQNWQIINAAKGDVPGAWAINRATGAVMYCTAEDGALPSCEQAGR